MQMRFIALLVVAIFHGSISAIKQDSTSNDASPSRLQMNVPTTLRFGRSKEVGAVKLDSVNDEERMNVPGVSKLADLDREIWKARKLDMHLSNILWVATGKSPQSMFTFFHLDKIGDKIDETTKVIQWFRFAKKYRATNGNHWLPDREIYTILGKSKASETKLAMLFESLQHIPDLNNLATTMKTFQLNMWINRGHTPDSVATLLGISKRGPLKTEFDPRFTILDDFTKAFKAEKLKRSQTMR
ncbi:Avirulence protein (Avh) [Phytophthora palmivora]|uniref:Avirulence protein (Avh) n=1 Tax=Phytophthora palmivora TaxID=4796 RepID=A0A2P4WZC2_9STRA|nr:Avirulence protein (Avh) [Phytophthora palmivora]